MWHLFLHILVFFACAVILDSRFSLKLARGQYCLEPYPFGTSPRIGYKYPDPPTTNVIFPFQIDDNLKLDASQIELALSELNIKLSAQQSHRFNRTQVLHGIIYDLKTKITFESHGGIILVNATADIRKVCDTVDFLLASNCDGRRDVYRIYTSVQPHRNMLSNMKSIVKPKLTRGSSGFMIENMSQFGPIGLFECDRLVKYWISTISTTSMSYKSDQYKLSQANDIPLKDLNKVTSLSYGNTTNACGYRPTVYLKILPKLTDVSNQEQNNGNNIFPLKETYDSKTQNFLFTNDLPKLEPNFRWGENETHLKLQDNLNKDLWVCFVYGVNSKNEFSTKENGEYSFDKEKYCPKETFTFWVQYRDGGHRKYENIISFGLEYGLVSQKISLSGLGVRKNCEKFSVILHCHTGNETSYSRYEEVFERENSFSINATKLYFNKYCKVYGTNSPDSYVFISENNEVAAASSLTPILISVLLVILLSGFLALFFWKRSKKIKVKKDMKAKIHTLRNLDKEPVSEVFEKVLQDVEAIKEEFQEIENISKEEIETKETCEMGRAPEVVENQRNRYKDRLPFDSNIVLLKQPKGQVPLDYVNASPIKFSKSDVSYIAAQAPKKKAMSSFWQMILEKNVGIIVMITRLVENKKIKADKYWPDEEEELDFEGIKITVKSEIRNETFLTRTLQLEEQEKKVKKNVIMIHSTSWPDMTAPDDTHVLLDLVYAAQTQLEKYPGTIVVHCSAGVGRTGSFLAVHKIYNELLKNVARLPSVYDTVLAMRKQRMKMVQTAEQYVYVYQCVRDLAYVIEQTESDYIN